jgi:uncharacterized protein (TIGR02284 family)
MPSNLELRATLNELIQSCRDSHEGFLTAAENIEAGDVKNLLNHCSLERAKFAGELQTASHELGDSTPEYAGSAVGALHRGWINLKTAIMGRSAHGILVECERGEDRAVAEYQKILQRKLPANIREIVERQYSAIQATHHRLKAMRDAEAPK